jgi:hypothetical protein
MPEKIGRQEWYQLLRELENLRRLHDETMTNSMKCREFNSRCAFFLQRLEDMECNRIADIFMDLLGGCSPKDFSHCDNHERTKGMLERTRARIKENMDQSSG